MTLKRQQSGSLTNSPQSLAADGVSPAVLLSDAPLETLGERGTDAIAGLVLGESYVCRAPLDLFVAPDGQELSTQAAAGRMLRPTAIAPDGRAVEVCLCEDDYAAWLPLELAAATGEGSGESSGEGSGESVAVIVADRLEPAAAPYQPPVRSRAEVVERIPAAIAFAKAALAVPGHCYRWGGNLGPNFDCSGLMQAAFASAGVWLPRNSYQQEAFAEPVRFEDLEPGDLIFFGTPQRTNHVALYLGDGQYIHSSGYDQGRGKIAIDPLSDRGDRVSQTYFSQLRGAGRIVASYQPVGRPMAR